MNRSAEVTHRQTASVVTEPCLLSQFACLGCRLDNVIYQAPCPECLSSAPTRALQPLSLCTPVTSCHCLPEFNRSGQPVCRLACSRFQPQEPERWPSWPRPSPSQNRSQREMPSCSTPPCLSSRKKGKGCPRGRAAGRVWSGSRAVRGGGEGRGALEGMAVPREFPPAMPCAFGCTSRRPQTSSHLGVSGCPCSREARPRRRAPSTWAVGKGLENAAVARSTRGARAPPARSVAGGGTAPGRVVLSLRPPDLAAGDIPEPPGLAQAAAPHRPQPPAHLTSLGLQDLAPKGCVPFQHLTGKPTLTG